MLIYNFRKEFLGIDDSDLKKMGFDNLSQLRAEAADFADLFVKTPGYVHNFKHVHWIDFIECAESDDNANVIIHANDKNFRCTIEIQTVFLVDAPAQKAYIIYLNNLRELSKTESEQVANDVYEKPTPQAAQIQTTKLQTQKSSHKFDTPVEEISITKATHDPYEQEEKKEPVDILDTPMPYIEDAPIELDIEEKQEQVEPFADIEEKQEQIESFNNDDFKLDIEDIETQETTKIENEPEIDDDFDNSYIYNPQVASDELGLPLDLIEEFIGDFIAQAHDFKEQLYTAFDQGDEDKVKILSHKLKGVAANLRIEDAFEVLSIINTSSSPDEIKLNLNRFYRIIAKLSGEEVTVPNTQNTKTTVEPVTQEIQEIELDEEDDDDTFDISFKDDDITDELDNFDDEELYLDLDETEPDNELSLKFDDEELKIEEPLVEATQETLDSDETYNKGSVANEIGIDIDSFNELFDDFITEAKLLIKDINTSIEEKNIELWKRNALKLKGMSDNMRVESIKKNVEALIQTTDVNIAKELTDDIQVSLEKISIL